MKAVLFDLDGTLVDTAPDLGYALNLQREKYGKPALTDAAIRPFASHGSKALMQIGFGLMPEDQDFLSMRDEYLDIYESVLTRAPVLFEGMRTTLDNIMDLGLPWGIVTNKPGRFTVPLIASMGLDQQAICVVSGDDASKPKPSPETLLLACERAKLNPSDCWYVGDAARDIEAGQAAGMKTVLALYGYIDQDDQPLTWGADTLINQPQDLIGLLKE